jgi:hypothetical protein
MRRIYAMVQDGTPDHHPAVTPALAARLEARIAAWLHAHGPESMRIDLRRSGGPQNQQSEPEGRHPREFIGNSSFPVAKACHPCGLRATSPQEVLLI